MHLFWDIVCVLDNYTEDVGLETIELQMEMRDKNIWTPGIDGWTQQSSTQVADMNLN